MKEIRWGIWGAGAIAHKVASDIPLAKGARLAAVGARKQERAEHFARRHGAARWYGNLKDLLADAEVDAIYIATPNQCHAADSIACLDAGKPVLCEKPFALNAAQAGQTVAAARRNKVFCMEAMWTRFLPAVIEAKRRIDAGEFGTVRMVLGNFAFSAPLKSDSRLFALEMGGGSLLDIGVYPISLTHHLLGAPDSVDGGAVLGATGVDEQSAYRLGYKGGAMADLWSSLHVNGANELTVFGEDGTLRLCNPFFAAHRLELSRHRRPVNSAPELGAMQKWVQSVASRPGAQSLRRRFSPLTALFERRTVRTFPFPGNGYQFELMEVARCLTEGRTESSTMPLDDSLAVMRTMDALRAQWGLVYPQEHVAETLKS